MKTNKIVEKNKYLDIEVPNFDLIKIELWQETYQKIKRNKIESENHEFTLMINTEKISSRKDLEFSEKFMELTKMNFVAYDYKNYTYKYFTTPYVGDTEYKKELLKNIFDYLKVYEAEKKIDLAKGQKSFSENKEELLNAENEALLVKYLPQEKMIAVILKGFAGKDVFGKLVSASERIVVDGSFPKSIRDYENYKKFDENTTINSKIEELNEVLKEEENYSKLKGKTFFIIKPENYMAIKKAIGIVEENKKEVIKQLTEEQNVLLEKGIDFKFIEITEENDFNLYVKYNDEYKAYEFSCVGYNSMYSNGYYVSEMKRHIDASPSSVLSVFAKNFIYGKYEDDINKEDIVPCHQILSNSLLETRDAILMEKLDAKLNGKLLIPAKEFDKLKEIYENYQEQKHLFSRDNKKINIKGKIAPNLPHDHAPAIYTNGKEFLLVLKKINKRSKKPVTEEDLHDDIYAMGFKDLDILPPAEVDLTKSVSLIGKKITAQEVDYFFEKHDMAPMIKKNSYTLIGELNLGIQTLLTDANIEKSYNSSMLSARLYEKTQNEKKERKFKI